jgi:parvulin-like peptidyl-prolyl isomerase
MFLRRIVPFLVLSFWVVVGCTQNQGTLHPPSPDVVASFNGGVITKAQLNDKFEGLMPCCKVRYPEVEGRKALIKEMVLPEVISQSIKQKKIDLRGNIREKLGNLTDELNMSFLHMKFHEQILNDNEEFKDLRESYEFQKRQLEGRPLSERYNFLGHLHQKLHPKIAKEVEKVSQAYIRKLRKEASITKNYDALHIKATAEELKDFYQNHKEGLHGDEYRVPERVRVREMRIKVVKDNEDCPTCTEENKQKAREKATSALIELRSGARFQTVAKQYSSNSNGAADSRWIARGNIETAFEAAVFSLDIGEISQVLEKDDALHVVKVLEKHPKRFKSYEEIIEPLTREYRWQKGEDYLKENRDRILFTINSKPYTIGDFADEYKRSTPDHECHHTEGMKKKEMKKESQELCDLSHNEFDEKKKLLDRMIDRELITEDTYNQMIHVEHKKEIEFLTMASLYPVFHQEEMENLIHITDEMVDVYYQKHRQEYHYPAKAKLSMIVILGGETDSEKKKAFEKATKAYKEVKPSFFSFKKEGDFAEVARKYSEDPETGSKGGRLDVDVYECRNEIEYVLLHGFHNKIFSLKPGDISDVFEFGNDYYIIQVREMVNKKQATFDEVRERVKQDLMHKEHQKVMKNWEDDLLKSAGFVIYDQILEEVLAEGISKEQQKQKGA